MINGMENERKDIWKNPKELSQKKSGKRRQIFREQKLKREIWRRQNKKTERKLKGLKTMKLNNIYVKKWNAKKKVKRK